MSTHRGGLTLAGAVALIALAAALAAAEDWALQFEDTFEREGLGENWWASGLARIEDGELVVGREGDLGRNLVVCQREFESAIRLEYDAMSPVDAPCDLSAILNGTEEGYESGFFYGFGSQNNTTGRFLLKGQPGTDYDATITPGTRHHVICERDGARFRHIIDGETVLDYTHEGPLPGPLHPHFGFYVWHLGRFDNVRVYTKPEKVEVVAAVTGALPTDELRVTARAYPKPGKIGLSVDVPALDAAHVTVHASLGVRGTPRIMTKRRASVPSMREEIIFDVADLEPGQVWAEVLVSEPEPGERLLTGRASAMVEWPGRDPAFAGVRVLNNLVWELLDATASAPGDLHRTHSFRVPIDRWLYIRTTADVKDGQVAIVLDGDDPAQAISVHDGTQPVMIAKRRATAGEHTISVVAQGDALLMRLEVRAIPDIQHSRFPTTVYAIEANGQYDWEFISRYILPGATTIITSGDPSGIEDRVREWIDRGGRWIVYTSRPGLHDDREVEQDPDALFEHFTTRPGFAHPLMEGVLVDEFYTPEDPAYPAYIGMAKRIAEDEALEGKGFFPYVAGRFGQDAGSVEFTRWCIANGGMICREAYLAEWPTLREGLNALRRAPERMVHPIEDALPGATHHTVWVPGTFSFPWPFADGFPSVNYNAYLDMQFHMLATHPAFFGLGGVHIWRSGYTDEERLRWIGRFFEHYCIEGKTRRVTADPYLLQHIDNPDFREGLSGWTVEPAAHGSLEAREYEQYGQLQGRYYRGNDTFLLMKRSAERPNVVRQTIRALQAGRLYSVKMISADLGELQAGESSQALHPLAVELGGCELVAGTKYQYQDAYPSRARMGQFTREHPLWLNLHWHVFRANRNTAELAISDWKSAEDPGGPAGQELMLNFIEVKPYLPD